ncbi:MAG: amidohydrolase family protein [Candidatus Neomarinimicrobiota bacterium]|nr:amidohydrolase family protein [Candidatus Neomarinimicrobiota bacterium]
MKKFNSISITFLFFSLIETSASGQVKPVDPGQTIRHKTPKVFVLKGATLVPEPGKVIETGEIVIRDGLIESVGKSARVPPDAYEVDLAGKTIYAGFIESYLDRSEKKTGYGGGRSPRGEKEKSTTTATAHWNPKVKPDYSALEKYELPKNHGEALRNLGFTTAHLVPATGIFRGQSALIHIGSWSQGAIIKESGPAQAIGFEYGSWNDPTYPNSLLGAVALIRQTFYDADWYTEAWKTYERFPEENDQPKEDRALAALGDHVRNKGAFLFETDEELAALRAGKIGSEFDIKVWMKGNGYEYRRLKDIKALDSFVILPLNLPEAPNVTTWEAALQVSNDELRHWDMAPDNAQKLVAAKIPFSFTTAGLENRNLFRKNLLRMVERGFNQKDALAALTTTPAQYLGLSKSLGTLEKGKIANLVVTDGDYFDKGTRVEAVWIEGVEYPVVTEPKADSRGTWVMQWRYDDEVHIDSLKITGEHDKPRGKLIANDVNISLKSLILSSNNMFSFVFKGDTLGLDGTVQFSGSIKEDYAEGHGRTPTGGEISWYARRTKPHEKDKKEKKKSAENASELVIRYPEGAFGYETLPPRPALVLVKNATIWTMGSQGVLEGSDLLIKDGKVWKVGKNLTISTKAKNSVIINAQGKHVTPGLIDCHSHSGAFSINEGSQSVTAEVRIQDVLNSDDINLYRQLAGGLTTANVLHGSANSIGGQNAVIKLRWGSSPDELLFKGAPKGIKFALGENVKRVRSWGRYPETRMGVEQVIRDAFTAAQEYREKQNSRGGGKGGKLIPVRRDLELDALVEILNKERLVHSHSYRQDEILMLVRIAQDFDFKIGTFQHVLEGYKIAEAMAEIGAGASTFSDWWAYKFEVIDAIPYNGPLMNKAGVVVSYNSDSSELARRLNTEAAKAAKYGPMPKEEAFKFVTINPAIQLGIDDRVGSLEPGKDADFVIWNGDPMSMYTACEQTWVNGKKYFDLTRDREMRAKTELERNSLIQKILNSGDSGMKESSGKRKRMRRPSAVESFSCTEGEIQ